MSTECLTVCQGKEVGSDDSFAFNEAFHAPLFRIKINSIQMKETAEENAKTNSQVMQDRQYQVCVSIDGPWSDCCQPCHVTHTACPRLLTAQGTQVQHRTSQLCGPDVRQSKDSVAGSGRTACESVRVCRLMQQSCAS